MSNLPICLTVAKYVTSQEATNDLRSQTNSVDIRLRGQQLPQFFSLAVSARTRIIFILLYTRLTRRKNIGAFTPKTLLLAATRPFSVLAHGARLNFI